MGRRLIVKRLGCLSGVEFNISVGEFSSHNERLILRPKSSPHVMIRNAVPMIFGMLFRARIDAGTFSPHKFPFGHKKDSAADLVPRLILASKSVRHIMHA